MKVEDVLFERLKQAIYQWIGFVSVKQLGTNAELQQEIEAVCKKLRRVVTPQNS